MRVPTNQRTFFAALWLLIACPLCALGQGAILLAELTGEVSFNSGGTNVSYGIGQTVPVGTEVKTGETGQAIFVLSNSSVITVRANSSLVLAEYRQSGPPRFQRGKTEAEEGTSTTRVKLDYGEVLSTIRPLNTEGGSSFTVDTPVGSAGVRGTSILVQYIEGEDGAPYMKVVVLEGSIEVFITGEGVVEFNIPPELADLFTTTPLPTVSVLNEFQVEITGPRLDGPVAIDLNDPYILQLYVTLLLMEQFLGVDPVDTEAYRLLLEQMGLIESPSPDEQGGGTDVSLFDIFIPSSSPVTPFGGFNPNNANPGGDTGVSD